MSGDAPSLRPYQREAVEAVLAARRAGTRRMLVCLPTGAGKTVVFAHLARLARRPVLVIAHREELLAQAQAKLQRALGAEAVVAVEQGGRRAGGDAGGWRQLRGVSSAVMFLGVDGLRFRELGALRSGPLRAVDDRCVASCADWYGNARPIFWRGRVFALLGYELVEGSLAGGRLREQRRTDFLRALLDGPTDRSGNVFNNLPD